MAKKAKYTEAERKNDLTKFCAFWALAISAVMFVVGGVISFVGLGEIGAIFDLLAKTALVVAIAIPAYKYVRSKKKGWKIFYWIALAIYVFGVVFGVISFWR